MLSAKAEILFVLVLPYTHYPSFCNLLYCSCSSLVAETVDKITRSVSFQQWWCYLRLSWGEGEITSISSSLLTFLWKNCIYKWSCGLNTWFLKGCIQLANKMGTSLFSCRNKNILDWLNAVSGFHSSGKINRSTWCKKTLMELLIKSPYVVMVASFLHHSCSKR